MKAKNNAFLAVAVAAAVFASAADAQRAGGDRPPPPRTPAPVMADGTVDFGGDGVWNLPWVTDFAVRMPGAERGDQPPMLPWTRAMWEYNKANNVKYDPEGFCLPPGGPRSMGTPYPAEIVQNRDRIFIMFEGGGHVWREIYMDGREHPENVNPTYFGHSVGHWEDDGKTLVVDTVGFNEKTWLDFGGYMHTEQLHTVEKFTRPFKEVLHYETLIDDPGAYSEPWTVAWDINWSDGDELADYICQENNKFLLDMHDDLGQPFFEKSGGL
ncbi:MAG: hypothetical protein LBE21_08285 [Pseudomonadales bacterium]|jgi:hypothetical protein|nr:hypothetical protein [Pseudomonadales bacterium]